MKKSMLVIVAIIAVALVVGLVLLLRPKEPASGLNGGTLPPEEESGSGNLPSVPTWQEGGVAISGNYADAEVVDIGNGNYRMYYSEEPEVPGFSGKLYSSTSSDGVTWTQESGVRKDSSTFASIIKLPDGKYRMYFQNAGAIKSALSSDGLTWIDESGTRIDSSNNAGLTLSNVAAPTVIKVGSEYIMVYRGDIEEPYSGEQVPNQNTQLLLWATSTDGLSFQKKGIAVDSRNSELLGLTDGPEFADFDSEIRLYFWTYMGVYHVVFSNNAFSEEEFDYTNSAPSSLQPFPDNPPGDPTLGKIGGKWFMYYGQHTQGIYYATLE